MQYRRVRVAVETRRNGSGTPRRPYRPYHVYGVLTTTPPRLWRPYCNVRADLSEVSCPRPYDVLNASLRHSWRFYGVPTTTMAFLARPWFSWAIIYKTRCFSLSSSVYLSTSRLYVVLIIIMAEDMKNLLVLQQMLIVQQQQAKDNATAVISLIRRRRRRAR